MINKLFYHAVLRSSSLILNDIRQQVVTVRHTSPTLFFSKPKRNNKAQHTIYIRRYCARRPLVPRSIYSLSVICIITIHGAQIPAVVNENFCQSLFFVIDNDSLVVSRYPSLSEKLTRVRFDHRVCLTSPKMH